MAMAMAFMFVLVTIVIAMHASQSRALRTVTQAEAELQFRESTEFAVAEAFFGAQNPPALKVQANPDLAGDFGMPANYGSKLYSELPNWNPKDDAEYPPGFRTYKMEPKTSDQALNVFAGKFFWLVAHEEAGYAAYAPAGSIKLEEAVGWANPNFLDKREMTEAYSGMPLLLGAKGSIEVGKMPYGSAFSSDGPINLGDDKKDLALAFKGPLPMRAYQDHLRESLSKARTDLEGVANTGNKTKSIKGDVFSGAGAVWDMLMGGSVDNLNLSLEQAMSFPFPTIPSVSLTVPGIFTEFWFHVPYPPDFSDGGSNDGAAGEKAGKAVEKLRDEIKALEDQINALEAQKAATSDADDREDIQDEIDDKRAELDSKKDEWDAIMSQIEDQGGTMTSSVQGKLTDPDAPVTRAEDQGIPNTGQKGWNYSKLIGNMLSLLLEAITLDFKGIAEELATEVRLIHFGSLDYEPDFRFNDGFFAKASWTVPRGRSFKFDGKMTIAGDLWLQKGSVMQVTGDLILENPDVGGSSPLKPCGKLVMEEGSTLIVGGSFRAAGDPRFGSLWICSPPTRVAPVTSAIFVTDTFTLPYGSYSATNLEDAARAVEGGGAVADSLGSLFTDIAPNLSKVAGAFHERKPYFASYATTFQLTIIPPTIFNPPIPIPTPIPLPKENLLVPMFRAMTGIFAPMMNGSLGENTYLHADWWGFGEGVVPAAIKLNPAGPMASIMGLNLNGLKPELDWESYLGDLLTTVLEEGARFAVQTIGKKIITTVASSAIPGGSAINDVLNEVLGQIDSKQSAFETFKEKVMDAAVGPIKGSLDNVKEKLEDEINDALKDAYLREVGGPLIYAGTITVGDSGDRPRLMSGMLVAENNITVDTESFVGSMTSFGGNISAGELYFTPVFTRASIYKPKSTPTDVFGRVGEFGYGKNFDSGQSVDVTTGVWQVTTEGWNR